MVIWVAVLPRVDQLTKVMPNFWRAVYIRYALCCLPFWFRNSRFYPYRSGLHHRHWSDIAIVSVTMKQPWLIWAYDVYGSTKNHAITKQSMCIFHGIYCDQGGLPPWWRHQMKTFSVLLAICAGNSPVPGEFLAQRLVTRSFGVFFDLRLNKRLSKQSWGWWFETLPRPLWRHSND